MVASLKRGEYGEDSLSSAAALWAHLMSFEMMLRFRFPLFGKLFPLFSFSTYVSYHQRREIRKHKERTYSDLSCIDRANPPEITTNAKMNPRNDPLFSLAILLLTTILSNSCRWVDWRSAISTIRSAYPEKARL